MEIISTQIEDLLLHIQNRSNIVSLNSLCLIMANIGRA